jgi:hypothetical protein
MPWIWGGAEDRGGGGRGVRGGGTEFACLQAGVRNMHVLVSVCEREKGCEEVWGLWGVLTWAPSGEKDRLRGGPGSPSSSDCMPHSPRLLLVHRSTVWSLSERE